MPEAAPDVFTIDEIALAARVPRHTVEALLAAGELRPIAGTSYIAAADAIRAGRRMRETPPDVPLTPSELFAANHPALPGRAGTAPVFASTFMHAALILVVMWLTADPSASAAVDNPPEKARLVFLITPGPGGGGGGGGTRSPLPAARIQRRGPAQRVSVPALTPKPELTTARHEETTRPPVVPAIQPEPSEREAEPAPAEVVAPVVEARADPIEQPGVIDRGRDGSTSQGSGVGAGAGTGQGMGNGEGLGAGIGEGAGGGTGGGPYRPGSGIEPPRLRREVKAEYTEEARRRNLSGDVVLEIVVRHDGTVGEVRVLQGLGAGLDQRAADAVRQWRFDPARRRGAPVDVIVEVAVEFTLR